MSTKTIHIDAWYANQSLQAQKVVEGKSGVYRATIKRNAHDDQSRAYVERLDGRQWHPIHQCPIGNMAVSAFSYTQHEAKKTKWTLAAWEDCDTLIADAEAMVTTARRISRNARKEA